MTSIKFVNLIEFIQLNNNKPQIQKLRKCKFNVENDFCLYFFIKRIILLILVSKITYFGLKTYSYRSVVIKLLKITRFALFYINSCLL